MIKRLVIFLAISCYFGDAVESIADSRVTLNIIIKEHQFAPQPLIAPANVKFLLKVENQDATPEEFESYELNREKIVNGHKSIIVFLGPLSKGTYKYFGDFHPKIAKGVIVVQ